MTQIVYIIALTNYTYFVLFSSELVDFHKQYGIDVNEKKLGKFQISIKRGANRQPQA